MRLDHPSDRLRALAEKAIAGERLTDEELDDAFDEAGVSTEAQLRALALARKWVKDQSFTLRSDAPVGSYDEDDLGFSLEPCTEIQRAYLEAFERAFRSGEPDDHQAAGRALEWVWVEARDRRARGEFPELDEQAEAIDTDFRRAA